MVCTTTGCAAPALHGTYHCEADQPVIDLSVALPIDEFDDVMRAIEAVVDGAESLALDVAADRETLKGRLRRALGSVQ